MAQCVFCDATQNLNTSLTISLDDGTKVAVQICDTHAEDATVKLARAAYSDKQKKIEEIMAQAKALGLNITGMTQEGSLLVPQVQQTPKPRPAMQQQEVFEEDGDSVTIATEVIDSRKGMVSVGGATDHGHVPSLPSHDLHNLESKLPVELRKGKAKMTVVEGREGMPIAIPEKRVDGTGTTRIKVTKKEDDGRLQSRFKKMAKDSINDRTPDFARQGYRNTQSDCPICRGAGFIKQNVGGKMKEETCPKCNGAGVISTY